MSEARATGALLWLRAGLLGAISLLSGVVSHAAADGLLPSAGGLLALAGAATLGAAQGLRRRTSWPVLLGLVVAGQALAHLALSLLAGHRGDPVAEAPLPVAGGSWEDALMGGHADAPAGASLGWTTHLVDHVSAIGPGMVVAHLLGAVALGVWLAVGEAALWALLLLLAAEVRDWVGAWLVPVHLVAPAPARVGVPLAATRPQVLSRGGPRRRGPPSSVC